jgi:ribonuclease P protein component
MDRAERSEDLRYPKAERMRSDREYREVVRKGERATTPHFTVYRDYRAGADRGAARRKVGISVGKRVGGSVQRNRLKRILREFYRTHKQAFPEGSRTAIVAKKAPPVENLDTVGRELLDAMTRRWGNKGGSARCGQDPI